MHARQDITNGRVLELERERGRFDERLKGLSRAVYARRKTDQTPADDATKDVERRPITRREVYISMAVVVTTIAVLRFFGFIVQRPPVLP